MALKSPVEFKGKLNGLYLNLDPNEEFDALLIYLKTLLDNRASFYQGSRIIGVKGRELSYKQKAAIETLIYDQYGITVESLEDPIKHDAAINKSKTENEPMEQDVVLKDSILRETQVQEVKQVIQQMPERISVSENDTHFFFGTMRSGKSIHFPGHVVVIGDVNPGAEIVAEGNIIVMGRILGFVHAGSAGNDKAIVIANLLKPTQIRISTFISVPPSDDETHHTNVPEKATVYEGVIKIEKCH